MLTEEWIDVLAVVSSFSCTMTGILAARMTDRARGHMKTSITSLLFVATVLFTLLSLVSLKVRRSLYLTLYLILHILSIRFLNIFKVIPVSSFTSLQVWVATLLVLGQNVVQMASPLLLEFTVEVAYPVSEVVSGGAVFLGSDFHELYNFLFTSFNFRVGSGLAFQLA